jgi:hypothetical protein
MEASIFLVADRAGLTPEGKLNLQGVFHSIHASDFPTCHPDMTLALGLTCDAADCAKHHDLVIQLVGDEMATPLWEAHGELDIGQPTDWELVLVPPIMLRIVDTIFPQPGVYAFVAYANGELIGQYDLKLKQGAMVS